MICDISTTRAKGIKIVFIPARLRLYTALVGVYCMSFVLCAAIENYVDIPASTFSIMASGSFPARLSRRETELKKNAFRDYARSEFDDRDDRRPDLPHLNVIESEERRISKIKKRFKDNTEKLKLLGNVAGSRKSLIQHLSKNTRKETHRASPLNEQEAESSNGLENEIKDLVNKIKDLVDQVTEPVDGIKELVDKAKGPADMVKELMDHVKEVMCKVKEPVDKVKEPVDKAKELVDTVKELCEKIREPIDEFRAGVMYFKKVEEGKWRGEQCQDVDPSSGDFPNQKIKMDTILSDTAKNRKLFKRDGQSIKYFHFPANHMEWIEVSIGLLWSRSD